jgi:hypothetical protein
VPDKNSRFLSRLVVHDLRKPMSCLPLIRGFGRRLLVVGGLLMACAPALMAKPDFNDSEIHVVNEPV